MIFEITTLVLLVVGYITFLIARWAYKRHQVHQIFKRHHIPGPRPNFLDGNLNQLKKPNSTPNDVLTVWLKEYGDVFGYFVGSMPHLVVNNLEILKQVMIKDFHNFVNRPEMFLAIKPLIYSVIAQKNQRWKDIRSVLTPTFSSNKIKLMTKTIDEKVLTTVKVVTEKAEMDVSFDIYELVQGLTLDVIADCALAMNVNCQENPKEPFLLGVKEFFRNAHNPVVDLAIMFPFVEKMLTFLANYLSHGQVTHLIVDHVNEAIRYRRQHPDFHRNDMVQLMLDASVDRSEQPDDQSSSTKRKKPSVLLTDDEIIANAFIFLVAGYETTATALAFTFYLLIKNPEVQEKLYNEICEQCPDGEFTYDSLQKLQYMDQVIQEALRIYPPVTGFVSRQCQEECVILDQVIPKGAVVLAPVWDIHHNPEIWPDPWTFDPDRFSSNKRKNIENMSFLPFGIGPRNCIGMRFAQLEEKMALTRLIQKFTFVTCKQTEDPLTLICPTVIINPSKGVWLKAIPRDPVQ